MGERLPKTIMLALVCHFLASVLGITFGILAATRQYSWTDTVLSFISFLGMTIPRFLLALIILYVLAFRLNVQELGSFYSSRYGGQPYWLGFLDFNWAKLWNLVQHVWPVVFIATIGGLAYNMRVMRGNLLDTLNQQYVETARAKGLPEHRGDPAPRGAERAAPARRLSGGDPALHADRRDRGGDRVLARDRRSGHRRLDGDRRRLRHRDAAAGAGRDADHRQHHRRSACWRCSILGSGWEATDDRRFPRIACRTTGARTGRSPTSWCRRSRPTASFPASPPICAEEGEDTPPLHRLERRAKLRLAGLAAVPPLDSGHGRPGPGGGPARRRRSSPTSSRRWTPRRRPSPSPRPTRSPGTCRARARRPAGGSGRSPSRSPKSDELDPVTFSRSSVPTTRTRARCGSSRPGGATTSSASSRPNIHFIGLSDGTPLHLLGTDKLGRDILVARASSAAGSRSPSR